MSAIMAKPGRPTDDPKQERLTVRLSKDDLRALRGVAKASGVTLGEAARRLLRAALEDKTQRPE